ncbi:MAG: hypothetical protein NT172_12820 [Planctomycetota bacterium]|nr:hypothetical protein [Planctomycetota bacterium]
MIKRSEMIGELTKRYGLEKLQFIQSKLKMGSNIEKYVAEGIAYYNLVAIVEAG